VSMLVSVVVLSDIVFKIGILPTDLD
jgi:hypothetical protein